MLARGTWKGRSSAASSSSARCRARSIWWTSHAVGDDVAENHCADESSSCSPSRPVPGGGRPPEPGAGPETGQAAVEKGRGPHGRHQHREPGDAVPHEPREEQRESDRARHEGELPHQSQHPQPEIQPPDEIVEGKLQ